ncbi:LIM domain only protein 7 isoform X3 [Betta splendens]|uniref:LIM domain only protein 7 isoform X3 n=1 Tax=Betta splendens TaxID=158456 RepID=A0A9W2XFU5_BETSP|nr:LIM domain only protein 7 isoform X3 [Betta splendens]
MCPCVRAPVVLRSWERHEAGTQRSRCYQSSVAWAARLQRASSAAHLLSALARRQSGKNLAAPEEHLRNPASRGRHRTAVTKQKFGSNDFRSELENGVLLCDLINRIKPGIIKRINRLPTPIAGLDNLNVFLKACGKLGLREAQLFHPGDLQDLSTRVTVKHQETNRRLKNVLITIFWLGRRAYSDPLYHGAYLNFKAFEGLLGTALYKALQETAGQKGSSIRDSGFGDSWCEEREELYPLRGRRGGGGGGGEGGGGHRRDDSLDSLDSLGSRPHSVSSDATLKGSSEGCCSDAETDSDFRMAENKDQISYRRSVVITPKTTTQFNQFLPTKDKSSGYVPAPLRKKRAERSEDSVAARRSWANPSYSEEESPLTRQQQEPEALDGSKSTSDILAEPAVARQVRYEELQKFREHVKQSEDKWQDDLSKWKSRRRSVNSDIVKKKEERETIEQITYGSRRRSKTFKEMQEERENKGVSHRLGSLSYLDDEDVFAGPVVSPRSRTLPPRSHTIDTSYFSPDSTVSSEPPSRQPEPRAASSPPTSRAPNAAADPTPAIAPRSHAPLRSAASPAAPPSQQGPVPARSTNKTTETPSPVSPVSPSSSLQQVPEPKQPLVTPPSSSLNKQRPQLNSVEPESAAAPLQKTPVPEPSGAAKKEEAAPAVSSSSPPQKVPALRRPLLVPQANVDAPSSGALYKQQPQPSSMEPKPPGVSRVSASLPRSYQRSDSARLTSVVAPRPFGSQASRISSLPRASTMDTSNKRVNGDVSKKSTVPSRYHQFMTSEDEAQSSSAQSSEEEEEEEEKAAKSVAPTQSVAPAPAPTKSEAPPTSSPAKEAAKESFCDMRINLNQKPNSSRDFGFQANWDSTGARVTSIQTGSPAEMCQLQAGDEVLTVNGHQVAGMSYTDWKACMGEALQEGSLVMDVRRHGQNTWDRDPPSLPFKRHKTINLTSTDHPVLLGPDSNPPTKTSLDFTSRIPPEPKEPAAADDASSRVNGSVAEEPVTMRNKESEPISLKNLKRRSEFFEQGGSEAALPDIPVPPITPSSSRWSWDPEEERRRQEKWQKEQERLLQEKYKRDQEKLQEEWLKAQQEVAKSQPGSLEVNSHSVGPRSPLSPTSEPASRPWEEEERKRREELERQRQAEERRKREEEERQLRLLQEERKRKEKQEEEERRRREEEELRWQRKKEEEREEERRRQRALEQQWAAGSSGFDSVQPPLSSTDRAKSKSSPQLDEEDKPQRKGAHVQPRGMAQWLLEEQLRSARDKQARGQRATSELEMERRNILNAMRYRDPERATGNQPLSQVELERQQILNEMKKKTPLLTDASWIRQRSPDAGGSREGDAPPMRRGESLDNLDTSYSSWRSSWTPKGNAYVQSSSRPHSALSGARRPASSALPSSYSMGSLRGGAGSPSGPSAPWSRQTPSPSLSSPSPVASPEPTSEASQQRSSASTASPTWEARKPAPKSEYGTSSFTATPATCDSKVASQQSCDGTALQQIDEETTCDNNP